MIPPALRDSLAVFDDAALATLANPGLVRRAHRDLDDGRVRLVMADANGAQIEADGQLVKIDARGPKMADCACKSAMVCRHRIAAVLFVLAAPAATEDRAPLDDPRTIAEALDLSALERWAGKANWRAALELCDSAHTVDPGANALAVHFEGADDTVRILRGQSFDGIVSKAAKHRQKALHAAAVLAARRHFGLALPAPPPDEDDVATGAVVQVDTAFLERIGMALGEVAALGFNLAPLPLEESLFELSVSSRADSLPRLSAMLRAIAAQVRLRRQRALAFDPDTMLETTATAFALTRALQRADGDALRSLVGQVRRDFHPIAPLTLIGCGGERWRTSAGARGVTAWFVDPANGHWLSTTLARGPGQDPAFMPGEAWRTQVQWHGAPLAQLAHARFALTGAHRSADGRLSAPAGATAQILESPARPDPDMPGVIRDWNDLREAWLQQSGLGLATGAASAAVCLLSPTQTAPVWFDDLSQQLVWPLCDTTGHWLPLTMDHDDPLATALEALETTVRHGWRGMVLAKLRRNGDRLAVTPLTLLGADTPIDLSLWSPPWSPQTPNRGTWFDRLRRRRPARQFMQAPRSGTDAAIAAAWRAVLDQVEAGSGARSAMAGQFAAHADRLDTYGLPTLARHLRGADENSGLLALAYALLVARQQRCEAPQVI